MALTLANDIARYKKDELILKMQGTKKSTLLKKVRQDLLGIKRATELAEILDISQQTLSKLERGINKLSGAQYLAICSLLDKEKNELLNELNIKDKNENVINHLVDMSVFYNNSFVFDLVELILFYQMDYTSAVNKQEFFNDIIHGLLKRTCFENWLSCVKCKETISKEKEKRIINNGIVIMSLVCKDDLLLAIEIMDKHLKKNNKGILFFDYDDIIPLFRNIKDQIDNNDKMSRTDDNDDTDDVIEDDVIINFLVKFSILKNKGKIKFMNISSGNIFNIIEYIQGRNISFISQDIERAHRYKFFKYEIQKIGYNQKTNNYITQKLGCAFFETGDIYKYELGSFKIWNFDNDFIESCIDYLFDNTSESIEYTPEASKVISSVDSFMNNKGEKLEERLDNLKGSMNEYADTYKRLDQEMNKEMDDLLDKILSYLKPNN